jgi:ribosome maturation protein Sdo1
VQNTVKDAIKELVNYLDTLELTEQQRSCLLDRIYRKVIISKEQINPSYVQYEVFEATGMEYMGKLRLIENAVSGKDMLEICIPADNDSSRIITYLGRAIQITKGDNDSFVKIQIEPDKNEKFFPVSKIAKVKLIKRYI